MFGRRHRLHRLSRVHRLRHLGDVAGFGMPLGSRFGGWSRSSRRGPFGSSRRRARGGPSAAKILLAGLAVFALVRLMANEGRMRSTAEKLVIGVLVAVLGAVLLSLRRSTAAYRWS